MNDIFFSNSDTTFELKKYKQLVLFLHSIVKRQASTDSGDIVEIANELIQYFKEAIAFASTLAEATNIYNEIGKSHDKFKTKILTAQMALLTGLISIQTMAEMNPVDHIEKYKLKVKYIEEDVKMFDTWLSVFYIHGLVTGSITNTIDIRKPSQVPIEYFKDVDVKTALGKVHPYCPVILELKESTAEKVRKYALGNTFRPEQPSYGSFVKVNISVYF